MTLMSAKILVVDDDPDMVELLRATLRGAGYTVHTAVNGEQALAAAAESSPDLILLDVVLPQGSGYSVCEKLRRKAATAAIPVLMMTVLPGEFPRMVGAEAGANDYLKKPFQIPELLARVKELLQPRQFRPEPLAAVHAAAK